MLDAKDWCTQGTIALELPTKADLETVFSQHANKTMFNIGVAVCHESDEFVKANGRALAVSRMSYAPAELRTVEINGIKHAYHFLLHLSHPAGQHKSLALTLVLSTMREYDKVNLVYGEWV